MLDVLYRVRAEFADDHVHDPETAGLWQFKRNVQITTAALNHTSTDRFVLAPKLGGWTGKNAFERAIE